LYEQFFGFRTRPFDLSPDPRFLVLTESHQEALSNLVYAIRGRKAITLLLGEAGSGKTTIIRAAIDQQAASARVVYLNNPTLSRAEFVEMLAVRFGLSPTAARSKTVMLVELEALLRKRRAEGETLVLVLDEAQSLSLELLEEVRLLANIETDYEKLLPVIIAGQPELAERLNDRGLLQLKQRIDLRCELRALTPSETAMYLYRRICAAGGTGTGTFTGAAVGVIHEYARGLPRTINVIADNALLGGLAAGERPVNARLVREVCRDFDIRSRGVNHAALAMLSDYGRAAGAKYAKVGDVAVKRVVSFFRNQGT
jgi:general secretion pathway protein A